MHEIRKPLLLRWWPLIGLGLILAILLAGHVSRAASGSPATPTRAGFSDKTIYLPATPPPAGSEVVKVGLEPIAFEDVDPSRQQFKASFFIWWRWRGAVDPVPTTDILNSAAADTNYVVNYSYTNAAGKETPTKLPNGDHYQGARITTGISDPFTVGRYPIDSQDLLVRFENNTYDNRQVIYEPDTANMTPNPEIDVAGWSVKGVSLTGLLHQYGTNFGFVGDKAASQYSQLLYNVRVQRPVSHFLIKLLFPMLVIFSAALAALLVKEDKFDVRLVMVGTGLLTLILLQQGYGPDLPATAPGVLMDKIYLAAYVALVLAFLRVIFTANQIHHHERQRHDFIKGDRIIAGSLWVSMMIATGALIAI